MAVAVMLNNNNNNGNNTNDGDSDIYDDDPSMIVYIAMIRMKEYFKDNVRNLCFTEECIWNSFHFLEYYINKEFVIL